MSFFCKRWKEIRSERVAENKDTGIFTSPKLIVPFHDGLINVPSDEDRGKAKADKSERAERRACRLIKSGRFVPVEMGFPSK